jgi:hypothetical protein
MHLMRFTFEADGIDARGPTTDRGLHCIHISLCLLSASRSPFQSLRGNVQTWDGLVGPIIHSAPELSWDQGQVFPHARNHYLAQVERLDWCRAG